MTEYLTQYKFAQMCGVSKQAINIAIKEGRVVKSPEGVDPEHLINRQFKKNVELYKARRGGGKASKSQKVLKRSKASSPEEQVSPQPLRYEPSESGAVFDRDQKLYEDTRLSKVKADMSVLKYAKEAEAVIDIETLKRKMGKFTDFLMSHLVSMPEDICAMLWMSARAAEDPEREIKRQLAKRVESIIEEAKLAAQEITPPESRIKYVLIGMDDEEASN